MCIAVPGKVISIDGNFAKVDFGGNTVKVNIGIVEPDIGEYVLVHAGCAIQVMGEEEAREIINLYDEISGAVS